MNEAKQKAVELVEKYAPIMPNENWHDRAKQCAIIAVEEIIKSNPYYFYKGRKVTRISDHSTIEFWLQVKAEIEQL